MVDMPFINDYIWHKGKPYKPMWVLAFFPLNNNKKRGIILQLYFNEKSQWMFPIGITDLGALGQETNEVPAYWMPFPEISCPVSYQDTKKHENLKMKHIINK